MRRNKPTTSSLTINEGYEADQLEFKIEKMLNNGEPLGDAAPLTYTERKDGVQPDYNVRTDKWEHAVEAMDKVTKDRLTKRENRHKPKTETDASNTQSDTKEVKGDQTKGNEGGESGA